MDTVNVDPLAARAEGAKLMIPMAKRVATLDWYRACADVVADEKRRRGAHGAQRRAAVRLKVSEQYLGRMLADLASTDAPTLDS